MTGAIHLRIDMHRSQHLKKISCHARQLSTHMLFSICLGCGTFPHRGMGEKTGNPPQDRISQLKSSGNFPPSCLFFFEGWGKPPPSRLFRTPDGFPIVARNTPATPSRLLTGPKHPASGAPTPDARNPQGTHPLHDTHMPTHAYGMHKSSQSISDQAPLVEIKKDSPNPIYLPFDAICTIWS